MYIAIDELDPQATLARAELVVRRRRASELEDLLLVAHWADLHADDPRHEPGGRRTWSGEDRLVEIGGDGTPLVRELSLPELAIARGCHALAARAAIADVLARGRLIAPAVPVRSARQASRDGLLRYPQRALGQGA